MCFCKSQFPWKSCIVDRTSWSCTCTSVITGDQNRLCTCFGNTCCNCTHTCFRYQFDRNICIFICILKVINQLCQVLDRIDIVMRWRGDQADTRCGMTGFGNPWIYFLCRKMSTFTRFCTLCHLDLDFSCRYKITAGYTETSAGNLFDRGASVIAASCGIQSFVTFTALTCIGFSMKVIHGDRQCLMCFL